MSTKKQDYKHTVHLPKTAFPMKANLPEAEPKRLELWEGEALYRRIRERIGGRPKYILHDGPPYANGNIHIGHALNKILKDIIVKYKTMRGFDALYVPGWDCHGLPIEHQCLKEMGKRQDEVERVDFRKQARKYAERFIHIQREEFKRLGVFGEWNEPYRTMDFDYQASIAECFLKLYELGFIEQRSKPVPWCYDCETALADAELEYEDRTDTAVYVAFPNAQPPRAQSAVKELAGKMFSFLVWTTTPWTLPANVGLAVHPDLSYVLLETDRGNFLFAEALKEVIIAKLFKIQIRQAATIRGSDLVDWVAQHPFLERSSKVIHADYVSATDGTGIVHIAPGHGEEDYQYGHLKNNLPIISPVDEKGRFTPSPLPSPPKGGEGREPGERARGDFVVEHPEFRGIHVFKANQKIIEMLKEKRALLHQEVYPHSYPHCWRCKNPVIFRATPQWFLKIDHRQLRQKMSRAIQSQIRFSPDWGKNRIGSMVETRPDWCLSRQRYWGVPIPIIKCKSCRRVFAAEIKDVVARWFKERGADVWFEKSGDEFLGGKKPSCCQNPQLEKEIDIIDVWFDSGVSHQAVLKKSKDLTYPADLYLEGSDQHRGWFQSALTTAIALDDQAPFRGVLTHGFVVDGAGKKMSKSAGNVVAPQDVMKEFGADILRLWVSSCDYQFDVRLSKEILNQMAEAYRKIRNTFRYVLGNLQDFNPKKDRIPFDRLHPLDQWAVTSADRLVAKVDEWYQRFQFHRVFQELYDFCSIDLSSYYFDVLKDALYTAVRASHIRRSAQTGLFEVLARLAKMFAPILSFTMDEVWRSFLIEEGVLSVHESSWEVVETQSAVPSKNFEDWERIRSVRDALMPALERKRGEQVIGASLDAKVYLKTRDRELAQILKHHLSELRRIFIVSQVHWLDQDREGAEEITFRVNPSSEQVKLSVLVERAEGSKCERCWNYSVRVGGFPEHPTLCERCVEAIQT